jgi:hypothetical protein
MDGANSRDYRLGEFIAAILSNPERAKYWAENCGWEAGTGYCSQARRSEGCEQCLFRELRDTKVDLIRHARQQRRRSQTVPLKPRTAIFRDP